MNSIEWLKKLIAYDTTSRHSNIALIDAVSNWFADHKAQIRLTYDESKQKANLFATLPAQDGSINGGLILSGHTDVVPVDGQSWDSDPFKAVEKNGYIYGQQRWFRNFNK
jgi:acetylornithine deacetylase